MSLCTKHTQDDTGKISATDAHEVIFQFNVPLTPEMFELLLTWCPEEDQVLYRDLVGLINWKSQLPEEIITRTTKSSSVCLSVCKAVLWTQPSSVANLLCTECFNTQQYFMFVCLFVYRTRRRRAQGSNRCPAPTPDVQLPDILTSDKGHSWTWWCF